MGGLSVLVVALLSPLARFAEQFFYLHMVEHLLVLFVAPPLLWLGAPLAPVLWALPHDARRGVGLRLGPGRMVQRAFHVATTPGVALTIFCLTTAIWHLPPLYSAAEGASLTHGIEHAFFFAAALLLWWPVVHPSGGRRRLGYGRSILYLFVASVESSLIGAFLFFARVPVYPYYARIVHPAGMAVLEDQHVGGLIMWILGGFIIGLAQIAAFARFLKEEEKSSALGGALSARSLGVSVVAGVADSGPGVSGSPTRQKI